MAQIQLIKITGGNLTQHSVSGDATQFSSLGIGVSAPATGLAVTPASNADGVTVTGSSVTSAKLLNLDSRNTSGTLSNLAYGASTTLAGALVGQNVDLSTNVTNVTQSVTGKSIALPATSGGTTTTNKGLVLTNGAFVNASGTSTITGLDVTMPAITQSGGTLTSVGLKLTGGTVSSGTSYAITTDSNAGNVGIGVTSPAALLSVGAASLFQVSSAGLVSTTPSSNSNALSITGSSITSASLVNLDARNTSGTIVSLAYGAASTLSGSLTGQKLDLSTNVTNVAQSVTGKTISLPATTGGATTTTKAVAITQGAFTNASGTSTTTSLDVTMPNITQSGGTLTSVGLKLTGGTVSSGTSYAMTTDTNAGNVGIGVTTPAALFSVGAASLFQVSSTGLVSTTPSANSNAITVTGTSVTSSKLLNLDSRNTSGTISSIAYSGAATLSGSLTGQLIDVSTNVTNSAQTVVGQQISIVSTTAGAGNATKALTISQGAFTNASGTSTVTGIDLGMPTITQSGGTLTSTGIKITGGTVNSGTAYAAVSTLNAGNWGFGTLTPRSLTEVIGGTLPAANVATGASMSYWSGTLANNNVSEAALRMDVTSAGTGSAGFKAAQQVFLTPGYSGSYITMVGYFENTTASTGSDLNFTSAVALPIANMGSAAFAAGTTTGLNVAVFGEAGHGGINVGTLGKSITAKNSATNIGVLGMGLNTGTSPIQVGGFFGMQASTPTFTSAALMADNGTQTSSIFVARDNGTAVLTVADQGYTTLAPIASTTGSPNLLVVTAPAHTTLTASVEAIDVNVNLARAVSFNTGSLATQRAMLLQAPTYAFVGASTLSNASTLSITGAPIKSTNATITNTYALRIEAGAVSTAGTAYSLFVDAPTGASSNYAAVFNTGNVGIGVSTPSALLSVGAASLFQVSSTGLVSTTPSANSDAVTVTGSSITSAKLLNLDSRNTSGTLANIAYGASTTLSGSITGHKLDLSTNVTNAAQGVTGYNAALPTTTAGATTTTKALTISQGAFTNASGTSTTTSLDVTMPAITQSGGTLTSVGLKITGGTVTSGTAYAITTDTNAGNVGIGTTTPSALLSVGSTSQFQVSSGGAITAATGVTSSGTITFSSLNTAGGLFVANGSGVLSQIADVATGQVLTSGGVGTNPAYSASPTLTTSLTTPLVIGGTTASSSLTLESTSGSGTTDFIAFKTASQTERMRVASGGRVSIGDVSVTAAEAQLDVRGASGAARYLQVGPKGESFSSSVKTNIYDGTTSNMFTGIDVGDGLSPLNSIAEATVSSAFTVFGAIFSAFASNATGSINQIIGSENYAGQYGAGNVGNLSGASFTAFNANTGNTSNMSGIQISTNANTGGGTVSLNAGIILGDQTGVATSAANNFFWVTDTGGGAAAACLRNDGFLGLLTTAPKSTLHVNGSQTVKRTAAGAGTYAVLTTDYIIGKTAITGGGDTITLPAAATAGVGKIYVIKDESGSAGTNNLTIDPNGAETIDGAATKLINTNYGSAKIYTDGTSWFTY